MKKQIMLNSIAIVIFAMMFLNMDNLSIYFGPWFPVLIFLPLITGLLSALMQNKDKSYDYITEILIGSIFFGVMSVFVGRFFSYFSEMMVGVSLIEYINPLNTESSISSFMLIGMYMVGGLVGVLVRGVSLVFLPRHQSKINIDISFRKSFLIAVIVLLGSNVYYVLKSVPPDGRWKFQITMTSLFIILFLVLYYVISKKMINKIKYNYIIWAYSVFLSLTFFSLARNLQVKFQYNESLYFTYISIAPYLIIFGLGIVCYSVLALFLTKQTNN